MPNILGVGVSGLNAAQAGLLTAGHNIANATTPGYNRQEILQVSRSGNGTGVGFFGNGTDLSNVRRIYSEFLDGQALSARTVSSQLDAYWGQINQVDSMLADPNSGVSPVMQQFYAAVQDVATHPASAASRQALLSGAEAMSSRFRLLDQRMTEVREGVNREVAVAVDAINSYADQIAELNQRIVVARASDAAGAPNDLLDQRDSLVSRLNDEIRTTTVKQTDGSISVFVGNGQPMVVGSRSFDLASIPSLEDPGRFDVAYKSASGATTLLNPNLLQGGRLGGLLAFRTEVLDQAQNSLGRVALGLASDFNLQHRLGQDLTGALGTDFFTLGAAEVLPKANNTGTAAISATVVDTNALTTSDYRLQYDGTNWTLTRLSDNNATTFAAFPQTVDGFTLATTGGVPAAGDLYLVRPTRVGARDLAVAINDTNRIAAAAPMSTGTASANTGGGRISAGTVNAPPPPNANLQQPVTITFTAANTFDVTGTGTGNPTGVAYTDGANITYNGWTVQISGTPRAGDVFTIGPNSNGVGDNRNALLLASQQTQTNLGAGTVSYQTAYSQMVSEVGNKSRMIEVTAEAQAALVSQTTKAQQSMSGVNLDEEAANLVRFQQAYMASGKVIQMAGQMFDLLLSLGG